MLRPFEALSNPARRAGLNIFGIEMVCVVSQPFCRSRLLGLRVFTGEVWSVPKYFLHPAHISDLERQEWAEQRNSVLESALEEYQHKKSLPIS